MAGDPTRGRTWPRPRPSAATRPRSLSPCSVGCAAEARGAGRGSCSSPPATPWLRSQPRGGCGACASPAGRLATVGQRGVLPSAPDREKVAPPAPPSLPPRLSVTEAVRKQALIRAGDDVPARRAGGQTAGLPLERDSEARGQLDSGRVHGCVNGERCSSITVFRFLVLLGPCGKRALVCGD